MAGTLTAVAVVVVAVGAVRAASTAGASADRVQPPARPVAVVMVPELTWANAPTSLHGFAKANLSMRTATHRAGPSDVYLSLGKGRRSSGLAGSGGVGRVEPFGAGVRLADWRQLQDRDRGLHYGGALGSVGAALRANDRRWALATEYPAAAAAATDAAGAVPVSHPGSADGIAAAVRAGLDAVFVAVPRSRVDEVLPVLSGTCAVVVSASTPQQSRHLGVLAVSPGCGLGTAGLASPSTHHDHLATLPDVSSTVLTLVGVDVPEAVSGAMVTPTDGVSTAALVSRDRRAWTADRSRTPLVWLFVMLHAVGAAVAILWRRARTTVSCVLLAIPAASFLMMVVPWWRGGLATGVLTGGVLAASIAMVALSVARRDSTLAIGLLCALTAAVVGVDALFGGRLQIDAPFGNSPVGAGRFFGVGNIGSGFLVASLLVGSGLAIERWGRRAIPWVAAVLGLGAVAGGAPQFGADVGGVLYAVPAYGLLLAVARRGRFTLRHAGLLGAATVVAVALFAAVDLAGGDGSQTHLARGLGGEGLLDEVIRKGERAVQTVKAPMANVVVIAAVALVLTGYSTAGRRTTRYTSAAVLVAAVLGSALNDSGANVAAAVAAVAWPAAMVVAARSPEAAPARESVPA